MSELMRPRHESLFAGPGVDDLFHDDGPGPGMVTVSSNSLYHENLPAANMTVGEIRARFRDRLDIDPGSDGEINGRTVDDDEVVRAGQLLAFVRQSGEKG